MSAVSGRSHARNGDVVVVGAPVPLAHDLRAQLRISYALHRVPLERMATLLPPPEAVAAGDIVLARVEAMGRNTTLELAGGRRCDLHEGDVLGVVFGNRYATRLFEGYARANGECCDLLAVGGLCGLVETKYATVSDPTRLRILGAAGDAAGHPLRLRDFALSPSSGGPRPRVLAVCGSSMDAGKTHAAMHLILGLRQSGVPVAGIKLTGTATGSDTWSLLDAGAVVALDFVDGGFPSTYLASLEDLLDLFDRLVGHAASRGAEWVVMEIADGLLERETAALLQCARFTRNIDAWVFATGDPLGAVGGVSILEGWGIRPLVVTGKVSMSPLGVREVEQATSLRCLTAAELQSGRLNAELPNGATP